MPEEKTPFQHETPMADETMFARLVRVLVERAYGGADQAALTIASFPDGYGITVEPFRETVRALLAELRDAAEDARLKAADERRTRTACDMADVREFIDAILAEAGGSGG